MKIIFSLDINFLKDFNYYQVKLDNGTLETYPNLIEYVESLKSLGYLKKPWNKYI